MATWTVSHYFQNPRRNFSRMFTNREDAESECRRWSDDEEICGESIIESDAGHYGSRRHNRQRITWTFRGMRGVVERFVNATRVRP